MKHNKLAVFLLIGSVFALAGCATPSVITLRDGSTIQTTDEPKFDEDTGFYHFKEMRGGLDNNVNKDQIISIHPAQ